MRPWCQGGVARFTPLRGERAKMLRLTARVWLCDTGDLAVQGHGGLHRHWQVRAGLLIKFRKKAKQNS